MQIGFLVSCSRQCGFGAVILLTSILVCLATEVRGDGPKAELERNCAVSGGPPIPVNSNGWPGATAAQCTCTPTLVNLVSGVQISLPAVGQICQFLAVSIPSGTPPGPYAVDLDYLSGQPESDCLRMLIEVVSQEPANPWAFGVIDADPQNPVSASALVIIEFFVDQSCKATISDGIVALQVVKFLGATSKQGGWDVDVKPSLLGLNFAQFDSLRADNWVHDFQTEEIGPFFNWLIRVSCG